MIRGEKGDIRQSESRPAPQYTSTHEAQVVCTLCAHTCRILPGESGICQVRVNRDGVADIPYYARVSAMHVDPVEKKPLYHFHPGCRLLSVGFLGCNFRCPFCQNYSISQSTRAQTRQVLPRELPELTRSAGALGVAYTYNEPTIHFEYLMEAAERVHDAGLANVVVTNGHLTPKPARALLDRMDAANVDLKSFNPLFYERELYGKLDAVKHFLELAAERTALEVTTLLIPGKNDSDDEVAAMASFIAGLSPDIPYHLSGYYPTYRYDIPPTSVGSVTQASGVARRYLHHVYTGNVATERAATRCAKCGQILIRRQGFGAQMVGLSEDRKRCAACDAPAPIHWFDA